jgi:hypothetical protein
MSMSVLARGVGAAAIAGALSAAPAAAQAPSATAPQQRSAPAAPPAAPPPASSQAAPATAAPAQAGAPAAAYSYDPQGRRDPFVSLLRRGADQKSAANRPSGPPGLLIGEVTVKGIVRDRTGFIAMIQGPDSKQTFIVRSGQKLMDGTVKLITADGVVFSQDVNDPLSMVKQKEIRKTVRATDGGRG